MTLHYIPSSNPRLINNLGSTFLILQALEREDANISGAMYTGTSLTGELGLEATTDPEKAMAQVVQGYNDKFQMVWFPPRLARVLTSGFWISILLGNNQAIQSQSQAFLSKHGYFLEKI